MTRRLFRLFALALAAAATATAAEPTPSRPNVILIAIDDMGWADLGCYGSTFHRTAEIDALASQGMRFTSAYAACPVCSPSRAALLTGKWPARLHLTDWLPGRGDLPAQRLARPKIRQQMPLAEVTLAELFSSEGYATASIGKWHLGGVGFGPREQGFELNIAGDQGGSPPGYFAPFVRDANAKRRGRTLAGLENAPEGSYLTDLLTDAAIQFIDQQREKPFLLYLPHYTVHIPLQAKEEIVAKYSAESPFRGRQNSPVYAAMIESLDNGIGRILKTLEERKLAENTIVIFTSDNGGLATLEGPHTPATSNAPLREGKGFLYEGGIRVPLIIRWPRAIKAGQTSEEPVCGVDLLPTLAELCGIPVPGKVDGVSLAPLLVGPARRARPDSSDKSARSRSASGTYYWHYPHYSNQGGKPGGAIREGDWKLIEFYEDGRRELFNVKADASESRNLAEKEPERVKDLAAKLAAWRQEVDAQEMTPNPVYRPNPQSADGTVTVHARTALVHGEQLRYEPLPHKETLGYWVNANDWASFEFTLKSPGEYDVGLLIGCGTGSGGSEVEVKFGEQTLRFTVEETGGFQAFKPVVIGRVNLAAAGRQTIEVRPRSKPGPAVMDLRQIRLVPIP